MFIFCSLSMLFPFFFRERRCVIQPKPKPKLASRHGSNWMGRGSPGLDPGRESRRTMSGPVGRLIGFCRFAPISRPRGCTRRSRDAKSPPAFPLQRERTALLRGSSAAFLECIERRVGRSFAGMTSSGSSSSTASSGSSTSAASRASREGALGAPASVSRMARASSSTSSSGTRIHPELCAEARPFYPATGPSSSMTAAPAASETFSVMAKPFYPTTDSSSSISTMPPALRCRVDLPPPWTPASSFFTPHSSDPSAAAVWATNPGEATNPDSPPEDPELSAAELESLGFVEVKEDGMGSEVPIKDQSQQFPGAGQDDQLGKRKQSVVGKGDQLGNGKQPMGLEQDQVRMPLFGSYRPPLPKEHQKEGMQQLLAQCNPEVEHMRSEPDPQVGAGSRADRQ